jgi:histidyl-tRNA synthetase
MTSHLAVAYASAANTMLLRACVMHTVAPRATAVAARRTRAPSSSTHRAVIRAASGGRETTSMDPEKAAAKAKNRAMIDLQPPKGTRDFPPEDMRARSWLFGHFRDTAKAFGFDEFDAPVLENEELFTRKAGEEICGQLYNFVDKGERRVALRPELTPSFARLILQQGKSLALPAKWFAVGQCWRYERMTRGRRREHYQWNMDIVGVQGVEAEAELLAAITSFFKRVGITSADVGIKVSSRKLLSEVLSRFDIDGENFAPVCVVVDKIEKLPREKIVEELRALGVKEEAVDGILAATSMRSVEELEALIGPDAEAVKDLKRLFEYADAYGYRDWLVFDACVVRGLAYYTGIVFEGFDRKGELRAICGGGRYDKLLGALGGEDQPMVGFGFGDAVIVELLKDKGVMPDFSKGAVQDLVFPLSEALRPAAMTIAAKLRDAGRSVDLVLEDKKAKWAFKQAERAGAERVVILGENEWAAGAVRVKNLATREEFDVKVSDL